MNLMIDYFNEKVYGIKSPTDLTCLTTSAFELPANKVLSIAYYYARNDYFIHRELASGKGFADIVLIPRKNVSSPVIVLELKYDKDADSAIEQIKRKKYPSKVAGYADNLLLVGINYDKEKKAHECKIERWTDPS